MHTTNIGDWAFIHNSDPRGGTVKVIAPWGDTSEFPFDVLSEFVGGVVRDNFIRKLEQLSGADFLERAVDAGER